MSTVTTTTRIQKDDEKSLKFRLVESVRDCLVLRVFLEESWNKAQSTKARVYQISKMQTDTYGAE